MNSISSNFVGVSGGLLMSIIAFSIVFLVIVGLMFVMMGVKMLAAAIDGAGKAASVPAPAAPSSGAPSAAVSAPAVAAEDDSELAAVISAAIAAVCGGSARVIAFSPTQTQGGSSTLWRASGRFQNSEGFDS